MSPRITPTAAAYETLRLERRQPTPPPRTRRDHQLDDLNQIIHILATALAESRRP